MSHFDIQWIDGRREPTEKPDPRYPEGIDLDLRPSGRDASCATPLPYPARRCGRYHVVCRICGLRVAVTTAGRPDDPRSMRVNCRPMARA